MSMTSFRKNILFSLSVGMVAAGLLCLNLHDFAHANNSGIVSDHTKSSDEEVQFPDECTLCILSAFGFAEPVDCQFIPVHNENEQIQAHPFFVQTEPTVSNTAPRAPPIS